jgi:hypothetical protein
MDRYHNNPKSLRLGSLRHTCTARTLLRPICKAWIPTDACACVDSHSLARAPRSCLRSSLLAPALCRREREELYVQNNMSAQSFVQAKCRVGIRSRCRQGIRNARACVSTVLPDTNLSESGTTCLSELESGLLLSPSWCLSLTLATYSPHSQPQTHKKMTTFAVKDIAKGQELFVSYKTAGGMHVCMHTLKRVCLCVCARTHACLSHLTARCLPACVLKFESCRQRFLVLTGLFSTQDTR